jgi:hypothetical protein
MKKQSRLERSIKRRFRRIMAVLERGELECCICDGVEGPLDFSIHDPNHPLYVTAEHKTRRVDGGTNDLENIGLAHRLCNTRKGGEDEQRAREARAMQGVPTKREAAERPVVLWQLDSLAQAMAESYRSDPGE